MIKTLWANFIKNESLTIEIFEAPTDFQTFLIIKNRILITSTLIRVWSERNRLQRTIRLGAPIRALSFTGSNGDLMVAFEHSNQVSFIRYTDYLPRDYMHKQMIDAIGNKENLAVMNKSSKNVLLKEDNLAHAQF